MKPETDWVHVCKILKKKLVINSFLFPYLLLSCNPNHRPLPFNSRSHLFKSCFDQVIIHVLTLPSTPSFLNYCLYELLKTFFYSKVDSSIGKDLKRCSSLMLVPSPSKTTRPIQFTPDLIWIRCNPKSKQSYIYIVFVGQFSMGWDF